jgi:pimeloyl-ACP methyl ester carboxylesterase
MQQRSGRRLAKVLTIVSVALLTLAQLRTECLARQPTIQSEIVRINSAIFGLQLALHHRFLTTRAARKVVLFAEGSAVPTSANADFKINGSSWMDNLASSGFDVWSLDYLGYGESSRYRDRDLENFPGRATDCASQLTLAVRFILKRQRASRLSLIGDSFGSLVAGIYATRSPQTVETLILFAPVTPVSVPQPSQEPRPSTRFHLVTPDDLWQLYASWLPKGEFAGLTQHFFLTSWGSKYLDSDPTSRQRTPASIMVPAGPDVDSINIAAGRFPYDPRLIQAPTLIIFGEWDSVATEAGGQRLFELLSGTRHKRQIVIGKGTHILQLESNRHILYREVENFLRFQ